jgi:hypothetical protein
MMGRQLLLKGKRYFKYPQLLHANPSLKIFFRFMKLGIILGVVPPAPCIKQLIVARRIA